MHRQNAGRCCINVPSQISCSLLTFAEQRLSVCAADHTQSAPVTVNSPVLVISSHTLSFPQRTSVQAYSSVLHNPRALFNLSRDKDLVFAPCQTRLPDAKEVPAGLKPAHVDVNFDENKLMF